MKRTVRGAIVAILGGAIAAAMAPACVEYPQSIIVTRSVEPKRQDDGTCVADGGEALLNGVIDLEVNRSGYVASLVVQNQLRAASDPAKARVETGGVYLLGASVRLTYANGEPLDSTDSGRPGNEFRTAGSGYIPPAGGEATITVNMIDGAAIESLKKRLGNPGAGDGGVGVIRPDIVIAYVRVQAQTLGGLSLESQEFQFPITVCSQCLVDFPRPPISGNFCPPSDKPEEDAKATPCTIGQNRRVSCTACTYSDYCKFGPKQP
jgi:hypothetical protein